MKNTFTSVEFLGRLFFVALFLPAGLSKLFGFEGTVGYFGSLGIPMASVAVAATIAIEVLGSIALLFGFKTRYAAFALAGFTFLASLAGHAFWAVPAEQAFVQQLLFFKNIAVIGGLLVLASAGAGKWSLDDRAAQRA
jgi:putative oxidoreductase